MRIAWYVATTFVGTVLLVLATLVTLVTAVTLVENAGILANQEQGATTALAMAVYGGITYAYQVLPIACFVGALAAGCTLAQRGELLAMEAMGLGRVRAAMPMFVMTGVLASLGSACSETVMPKAAAERASLQRERIQRVDPLTQFYQRRNLWYRQGPWLLYLPEIDAVADAQQVRFMHPVIYRIDAGVLTQSIEAASLTHTPTGWWLTDARREQVDAPALDCSHCLALPLDIEPADLIDITGNPREMTSLSLMRLIARRTRAGFDTAGHSIELNTRLAHPVSALALVALALPWSLNPDRRRTLAGELGPGIAMVALYLFVTQVFRLLALAHKISPGVGAWGAVLLVTGCVPVSFALYGKLRR